MILLIMVSMEFMLTTLIRLFLKIGKKDVI